MRSQKQSAMHRAGSDTYAIVIQIWKREKKITVSFIIGTHREFINASDHWHCLGGLFLLDPPQNSELQSEMKEVTHFKQEG